MSPVSGSYINSARISERVFFPQGNDWVYLFKVGGEGKSKHPDFSAYFFHIISIQEMLPFGILSKVLEKCFCFLILKLFILLFSSGLLF